MGVRIYFQANRDAVKNFCQPRPKSLITNNKEHSKLLINKSKLCCGLEEGAQGAELLAVEEIQGEVAGYKETSKPALGEDLLESTSEYEINIY